MSGCSNQLGRTAVISRAAELISRILPPHAAAAEAFSDVAGVRPVSGLVTRDA